MPARLEFVFGYGSLAAYAGAVPTRAFHPEGFISDLRGFRRCWGVAMDNRVTLPGYKYYLDVEGNRPPVNVAFLDLRRARGESVNGVCLPVSRDDLAGLDKRERNYERRDVTAHCHLPGDISRVWTYIGSPAGRRRLTRSRSAGRAVVDRSYLEAVASAFERLGRAEYAASAASLDPAGLPVVALRRHEIASTTIGP